VRETAKELATLQALIDRSHKRTGPHWSDEGVYVRLDADRFYTYSRTPEEFPS
jgi:hypothetical protein